MAVQGRTGFPVRSIIRATTSIGGAYNLKFKYTTYGFNGPVEFIPPLVPVAAGQPSQSITTIHNIPGSVPCGGRVTLIVQADIPGDPSKLAEIFNGTLC